VAQQDQGRARAAGNGCVDVGLFAQAEHEAANEAHHARHLGDGDRDDHVFQAGLGQGHQGDGQQHTGDGHQTVHDAHDDAVKPAHEAGDKPDCQPDVVARMATDNPTAREMRAPNTTRL
jgi:hypothetical protein